MIFTDDDDEDPNNERNLFNKVEFISSIDIDSKNEKTNKDKNNSSK